MREQREAMAPREVVSPGGPFVALHITAREGAGAVMDFYRA